MEKRVVFITNNFSIGGVERLLLNIVSHWDNGASKVYIATVFGGGPLEKDFRTAARRVELSGSRLPFARSPVLKLLWLLISPIGFIRIVFFLRRVKPEAVFTSFYQSDILGLPAAKLAGVKRRISIQHDVVNLNPNILRVKRLVLSRFATKVVAISKAVADFVEEEFGVPDSKIFVIHNGIDFQKFSLARKNEPPAKIRNICYVGRLEEIKGPRIFIEALSLLKKEEINFQASVVGGGSLENELRRLVNLAGMSDRVNFYGEVRDTVPFLKSADIAVTPSLSEGFGLVVIESLAAGKPVVASDLPAIRELVKSGINGFLFLPGDASDLSEKLKEALSDGQFRILKSGVNRWIEENREVFDISAVVKKYAEIALVD